MSDASSEQQLAQLRHATDLVRLAMAGNLKALTFEASDGQVKSGTELDHNGSPAGLASQPQESVKYVRRREGDGVGLRGRRPDRPGAHRGGAGRLRREAGPPVTGNRQADAAAWPTLRGASATSLRPTP